MNYEIKNGLVGMRPYLMVYKHYIPYTLSGECALVLIGGGGHRMKVWERTPDGREGWAPFFAKNGREVIVVEWTCNSPEVYRCSKKALCRLGQKENMRLIKDVVEKEIGLKKKIALFGWSMGGPQAFKLATDIIPERVSAVFGYAATGPLNFFKQKTRYKLFLNRPFKISEESIEHICDSPFFPKRHKNNYVRKYMLPISPRMMAIQAKHLKFKKEWPSLSIKKTKNIPPTFLVNGTLDKGHIFEKEKIFIEWLKKYQKDITLKYVKGFPHLGMLCMGNEKIAKLYLDWLKKRSI